MKSYKQYFIICGLLIVIIIVLIIIFNFKEIFSKDDDLNLSLNVEEVVVNENEMDLNNKIIIHIAGEVVNNGIVELKEGDRIVNAIEKAGGITEQADLSKINLAYLLEDGMKIYIPNINDEKEEETISKDAGNNIIKYENNNDSNKKISVNINTASKEELTKIPGVGNSTADKIINYRNENKGFKTVDDIKNVSGIGESKFANIKEYIYVK